MSRVRKPGRVRKSNARKYAIVVIAMVAIAAVGLYADVTMGKNGGGLFNTPPSTTSQSTTVNTQTNSTPVYARLTTSMGVIEVELFPSSAPKTVANFVNLADSGFYSNLVWHRIVKGFVIQTGDPLTRNGGGNRSLWGTGGSPGTVPLEIDSSLHNSAGYLGMARSSDPNSGSSQFYINLANNSNLDGQYTVFGKVISGMDVVNAIGSVQVNSSDQPVNNVFLQSVTILSTP